MPLDVHHLPLFRSPLIESQKTAYQQSLKQEMDEDDLFDSPQFHQHNEATNSELFYDLFFVANLTVFLDSHQVRTSIPT